MSTYAETKDIERENQRLSIEIARERERQAAQAEEDEKLEDYIPATLTDVISDLEAEGHHKVVKDLTTLKERIERVLDAGADYNDIYTDAPEMQRAKCELFTAQILLKSRI